jgi:hypothetical protein
MRIVTNRSGIPCQRACAPVSCTERDHISPRASARPRASSVADVSRLRQRAGWVVQLVGRRRACSQTLSAMNGRSTSEVGMNARTIPDVRLEFRTRHHDNAGAARRRGGDVVCSSGAASRCALLTSMKHLFHTNASEVPVSCRHLARRVRQGCGRVRQREGAAMVAMTVRQWRDGWQPLPARPATTMAITPCRFLPILAVSCRP